VRTAIKLAGEVSAPATISAPTMPAKREAKQEFASIIREYENGEIANDADVSKETVKCWKAGRALPQADNLFKLAQKNRTVQAWAMRQLGISQPAEFFNSPAGLTAAMAAVWQVMHQPGPDGDAVRAAMRGEK
jgi:prolyl oligopeptidase PreP (S9A serine peptidase family)